MKSKKEFLTIETYLCLVIKVLDQFIHLSIELYTLDLIRICRVILIYRNSY